jgi:hypothetical protein
MIQYILERAHVISNRVQAQNFLIGHEIGTFLQKIVALFSDDMRNRANNS